MSKSGSARPMYESDPSAFQTVNKTLYLPFQGRLVSGATLTKEFSNDIGTKTVRRTEKFASSSQMSQAARSEQIPLVAPDPLPKRTSANRSTYGTLVGSSEHKQILSQPIAGKSCIQETYRKPGDLMHITESSFATASAYGSSFEGNHQGFVRPSMTLTMHSMNEICTKVKPVIYTSKREAEKSTIEPLTALPNAFVTTQRTIHAPPEQTRASVSAQQQAQRAAFAHKVVATAPSEQLKYRNRIDPMQDPVARAQRTIEASYRPPAPVDIISGRTKYFEDRSFDPQRYKGYRKTDLFQTATLLGTQVDIITNQPKR